MARNPRRAEYHIGIICALAIEHATVVGMLDEVYPGLVKAHGDNNNYTFGRIGGNNLVVACLPAGLTGTVSAARVASDMRRTFRDMKIGLMVGIGGGVWSERRDIRLGDVVVSQPEGRHGGVVQWDFGKTEAGGHFHRTGSLNKPPPVLLQALQAIKSHSIMDGMDLTKCLSFMAGAKPLLENTCRYPGTHQDHLFQAGYEHAGGETCEGCDQGLLVQRPERAFNSPTVHYGNIASGNQVIKDAAKRDAIAKSENIICFEMEAAGLVDDFPCLVIRGVCDYADSHKNDNWEPYAAATAAAFARMLLLEFIRPSDIARPKYDGRVHSYIPFARNEIFVGRHEQLMEIERRRAGGASKFAIFGLGGIGKTQIALELAYRVKDNHPDCSIFWIPSTNKESFRQAYNEICEDLNLAEDSGGRSDNMAIVRNYLSREDSGEWLMILDNADDHDLWFDRSQESRLIDYVPQSSNGWVIMTSRDKRVATRFASRENSIEVMRMDEGTAAQMLGNILSQDDLDIGRSNTSALLDRLCCLPLAIMQAGAYINMNHDTVSIADYLSLLDEADGSLVELLAEDFDDGARYRHQQNAITNTWLISFDRIRKQQPLAAEYLACMSFFDAKRIPEDLLPPAEVKKEQLAAIQCLINYSFITEQRKGNFDMHRLVHMIMRNWLQRTKNYDLSVRQAVKQLTKVFDAIPSERTEVWRPYLPHVKHALSLHTEPEAKKAVHLLSLYGARLTIEGRYQESEDCSRQVLEIRTRVLGEAHDLTIFSRHQLCNPLLQQRRHKDVEKIYIELAWITTRACGLEHEKTLEAIEYIGWMFWKQRRWESAVNVFAGLIPVQERTLGRGHRETVKSKRNLYINLLEQRRWNEAEQAIRDVLATEMEVHSDWDDNDGCCPRIYRDKENLVDILSKQGRLLEAEALQREVIESKSREEGLENCTLASRSRLVFLLRDQDRTQEADTLQAEVLKDSEKLTQSTLTTVESTNIAAMQKLAKKLVRHERWEDAQKQYERLVQACLQATGEEYSQTLHYRIAIGWTLHKQKQYDQAEVILVEVVKMTTELLSPTHPETLLCKSRLVKTYLKQQKFDLANELQFDVLQTKRARLGEGDFSTLQEMGELADICESSGATDKAVRLQEDRTEITRKEMGPSHPDTLESMEALAVIYHKNKRCREERVIREELLLLMKSTRGHDHPDTLSLMQRLEPRFHGNGLRHKEEQLLIEGHEIIMKAKGPTHPDTLASMRSLASFYHEHGECDQSEILQFLVYVVTERTKGCDDPDTLSSMSLLASTYRCVNKPEMAEPLLVDLIERQRKVLGPNNEKTLESIASLAWMCYEQQRFKQAEELRQEILERTRSSRGPDDPETLAAMDQLAVMIWNQGRFHDAEAIFTKLVHSCKTVLPPGDQLTLLSATNLGVTLFDLRRWQDAEAQFEFVMQMGAEQPKAREAVQRSITYLIRIERVTGRPTQTLHLRERLEQYEEIDSESPDEWDESEIVEDPMEIDSSSVVAPVEDMSQSRKRKASRDLSI